MRKTALLTIAICSAAVLSGCGPRAVEVPEPAVIVVSGDTGGWLVPCGCTTNQSGGLLRRGSYVAGLRTRAQVVLADVGGASAGRSPYDRMKLEAILHGEVAMGVVAHNLGATEAALGTGELQRLAEVTGITWISANVRDRQGGPVAAPMVVVPVQGRTLAFVGVLGEEFASAGIEILPPRQAVLDAIRGAEGKLDMIVVLAYLADDGLRQLAGSLPEVDLVIGGPTGQPLPPTRVGPVLLISATNQGKFLARIERLDDRWTGLVDELDESYEDDADQWSNLRRFYDRLAERDVPASDTTFGPTLPGQLPAGYAVAGGDSCTECHEDEARQWQASAHAAAWQSLAAKGADVDPACQRCHTTGYGQPGGFLSARRSADRVGVGCESCHGPSAGHVEDPETPTAFCGQAHTHCAGCHDRENSPEFEYASYWEQIQHGGPVDD